jgi:hypothetical protein
MPSGCESFPIGTDWTNARRFHPRIDVIRVKSNEMPDLDVSHPALGDEAPHIAHVHTESVGNFFNVHESVGDAGCGCHNCSFESACHCLIHPPAAKSLHHSCPISCPSDRSNASRRPHSSLRSPDRPCWLQASRYVSCNFADDDSHAAARTYARLKHGCYGDRRPHQHVPRPRWRTNTPRSKHRRHQRERHR